MANSSARHDRTSRAYPSLMIEVNAPSRLHFGLLSFGQLHGRQFGGVGAMIDQPGLRLQVSPAKRFEVAGRHAERMCAVAERMARKTLGGALPACRLEVAAAPPEHVGLGTGTQLALAVAAGILRVLWRRCLQATQLADLAGRGMASSAVGTYGFIHGGLLVDAGKTDREVLSPLKQRVNLPAGLALRVDLPAARSRSLRRGGTAAHFANWRRCRSRRPRNCCAKSFLNCFRRPSRASSSVSARACFAMGMPPECVSRLGKAGPMVARGSKNSCARSVAWESAAWGKVRGGRRFSRCWKALWRPAISLSISSSISTTKTCCWLPNRTIRAPRSRGMNGHEGVGRYTSVSPRRGPNRGIARASLRQLQPSSPLEHSQGLCRSPGESLEEAARRETLEETGLVAGDLIPLGSIVYTKSRKRVHGFAGESMQGTPRAPRGRWIGPSSCRLPALVNCCIPISVRCSPVGGFVERDGFDPTADP